MVDVNLLSVFRRWSTGICFFLVA